MSTPVPSVPVSVPVGWHRLVPLMLGLLALYVPTVIDLSRTIWQSEEQGHGPLILAASLWLFYEGRAALAPDSRGHSHPLTWAGLLLGVLIYVFGRTQSIIMLELGSVIPVAACGLALLYGWQAVYKLRFPLFFLIFTVPLPGPVIDALTGPLKAHVSTIAETLLYGLGYPVARIGVSLTVGQYQLLVADACSGLNSMLSLTAIGIFYMHLMRRPSLAHNIVLLLVIPPIAFAANIIRVMILCLVTYHFGDEAGQGFVHGAAGMMLFAIALVLLFSVDFVLSMVFRKKAS